jgi:competence protein ComEC
MGYSDDLNPNNEMLRLELVPGTSSLGTYDLTGFRLHKNRGDSFKFPDGFAIVEGRPIYVSTGSGTNTETELYWGLEHGVWDNFGDCAHLVAPAGWFMYLLGSGAPSC